MSDTELKEKEAEPIDAGEFEEKFGQSFSPEEKERINELSDKVGKGYTAGPKKRSRLSRRQKLIGGGAAGVIASVIIVILSVVSGPGQIVHFAQLLQRFHFSADNNLMDSRSGKLIRWARTEDTPERRNLSYFGNKVADRYTTKLKNAGIEPAYNQAGRLDSLSVDPSSEDGKKLIDDMEKRGISGTEVDVEGGKRVKFELSNQNARTRRQIIGGMTDNLGLNKVSTALASRLLKIRAGVDFHPLKNISRSVDEKLFDFYRRVKEERDKRIANGVDDRPRSVSGENEPEADEDGNQPPGSDVDSESDDLLHELDGEVGDGSQTNIDKASTKFQNALKGAAGVALFCATYQLSQQIPELRYQNIVLPLMRMGGEVVTMGSQVQTGQDVNLDELGALTDNLYSEEDDTTWAAARSIQAELGQDPVGPDMPDETKPGQEKPGFFNVIDSIVDSVPGLAEACGAVTSRAGGWIIDIASWVGGGPVAAIADFIVGEVTGKIAEGVIRWLFGQQVALDAAGATFGNYANYGARLAANDVSISHGGSELSDEEAGQLALDSQLQLDTKLSNQSAFTRYFDLNEPGSLASKTLFESPELTNPRTSLASVLSLPFKLFSSLVGNLMPKAFSAEPSNYDYGFAEYGFTLGEVDNEDYDNPFRYQDEVESNLEQLNEDYGEPCFGLTIDPETYEIQPGRDAKRYDQIEDKCKDRSDSRLTKYRFYLADLTAAKALACYEGIDEASCSELGFHGTSLNEEGQQ